jgi:hypothetical protein
MEVSGQLHAPAALPLERASPLRYLLDRRLDGTQSRSEHGDEKNTFPYWESKPGRPIRSLVPVPVI